MVRGKTNSNPSMLPLFTSAHCGLVKHHGKACTHNEGILKYSLNSLELLLYSRRQLPLFHTGLTAAVLSVDWQWPQVQLPHACEQVFESQSISNWSWQELLVARFDLYKPLEFLLFSISPLDVLKKYIIWDSGGLNQRQLQL